MDKIAELIPCYNEALTIEKVVTDFCQVLAEDAIIYVYDNNSTDDTARVAREVGAVVRDEYQQDKGNVIRRMFREIDAECCQVAGYDTYPADCASEMAEKVLSQKADMAIGDRLFSTCFEENRSALETLLCCAISIKGIWMARFPGRSQSATRDGGDEISAKGNRTFPSGGDTRFSVGMRAPAQTKHQKPRYLQP